MKSFQDRLFEQFEQIANAHGCEITQQADWGNTGQLIALSNGKQFAVVARLHYRINSGISQIWFNDADSNRPFVQGADLDRGIGPEITAVDGTTRRRNADVFSFEAHDVVGINAMFARWNQLLGEGV